MNSAASDFGFLTLAFGHPRYLRQAGNLALSLRHHMPDHPIALITDCEGPDLALFDRILPLHPKHGKGVIQKLSLYALSPFRRSLFIDSDCICMRSLDGALGRLDGAAFAVAGNGYLKPTDREPYLRNLAETLARLGLERFPKFNGQNLKDAHITFYKRRWRERIFAIWAAIP